ncbi:MAG: hypothetical protein HAW67_03390 [Endozoicomonadaceae bacterium]|nr:hypothetical protein [Endozoicomonadaceae bacterium]
MEEILFFKERLHKAVACGGRDFSITLIMTRAENGQYVKNSKGELRFLDLTPTFEFKKQLIKLILNHSRKKDADRFEALGYRVLDRSIFNLQFSTPQNFKDFGCRFTLTLIPQDNGRILVISINIRTTLEEWQHYESQCETAKNELTELLKESA